MLRAEVNVVPLVGLAGLAALALAGLWLVVGSPSLRRHRAAVDLPQAIVVRDGDD